MTSQYTCWIAVALVVLCLFQLASTLPKPYNTWPPYGSNQPQIKDECQTNDEVETLCQNCEKKSTSDIVYRMCCLQLEDTRSWCVRYMGFGRQEIS